MSIYLESVKSFAPFMELTYINAKCPSYASQVPLAYTLKSRKTFT